MLFWDPGCGGEALQLLASTSNHFVKNSVIVSVEHDHQIASGGVSCQSSTPKHGFATGVRKRHSLRTRQFAEQLGHFTGQRRLRPNRIVVLNLFGDGLHGDVVSMSQQVGAKTTCEINVLVAIDIPQLHPFGFVNHDRVSHLFHVRTKAGYRSRIGHVFAVLLSVSFTLGHPLIVQPDDFVECRLLGCIELSIGCLDGREPLCLRSVVRFVRRRINAHVFR